MNDAAFNRVQAQVLDAKEAMVRVLPRQRRWEKADLHSAIGGFDRCSGAVASLAVSEMEKEGVVYFDDEFVRAREGEKATPETRG